ncbi:cupredoxin domain-containing protein [Algiphilus sp.]|uniref:cupredoxin domain-containing protein n=1 Tax=Algiphilus sp. TaxID=1872431 RepID=UPI003B522A1D
MRTHPCTKPSQFALAVVLGLAASTTYAADGHAEKASVPEDAVQVEIVDFMRFEPETIEVEAGTTVVWTNYDGSNHKVKLPGVAPSPRMHMESTWMYTFQEPGTYDYSCAMHPKMKGTVVVKAP